MRKIINQSLENDAAYHKIGQKPTVYVPFPLGHRWRFHGYHHSGLFNKEKVVIGFIRLIWFCHVVKFTCFLFDILGI